MDNNKCEVCRNLPEGIKGMLNFYKKTYEQTGIDFYFYKENEKINVADKKSFDYIFKKWGKKKREYAHIKEYSQS